MANFIKRKINAFSLQQKMLLFIALIISAILLAFSVLFSAFSSDAIIKKAQTSASRELSLIASNLQTLMNNINNHAIMLSIDYRLQQLLQTHNAMPFQEAQIYNVTKSLASITTNIQGLNNNYVSSSILFADGSMSDIGKYSLKTIGANIDRAAMRETAQHRAPVWTGPAVMQSKQGKLSDVFTVYKSIFDLDENRQLGYALLHVEEKTIGQMLRDLSTNGVKNYIIDDQDTIISGSNEQDLYKRIFDVCDILPSDFDKLTRKSTVLCGPALNRSLLSMQEFQPLNMRILSVIPLRAITKEVRILNIVIAIVGVMGFVLAFICAYFFSKSIIKPINCLIHTIEELPLAQSVALPQSQSNADMRHIDEFSAAISRVEDMTQRMYYEQKLKNDYKFKSMQAQVKPHFLYNTLETIISLIALNQNQDAIRYVKNLSDFYRISLSNGKDIITVKEEVALITNYLEIQKIRYAEFFDYSIQVDPATLAYTLPKLTLQPLVENAIYHGVKQKRKKGIIRVDVYKDDEDICLSVTDDGVGMTEPQVKALCRPVPQNHHPESFGLENVLDRLRLIYGERVNITVDSQLGKFTNVTMKFSPEKGAQHAKSDAD